MNPRRRNFMLVISKDSRQCLLSWDDWRLEFYWNGDRWGHTLWRELNGSRYPYLTSLEGTTEQAWPASPAFQDLHSEMIHSECYEIQLLGQAGKNHYSGAIRCDALRNLIDFDLAVRIQTPVSSPLTMSTYQRSKLPSLNSESHWDIKPESLTGCPSLICEIANPADTSDNQIRLIFEDLKGLKFERQRCTIRWKYQLVLAASGK